MKYALVTGGSRGIGRAVSVRLAQMGYYVIVNFQRNEEEANKTLTLIREHGADGELLRFDVGFKEEIQAVLGTWVEAHPDKVIEVLVNNAGIRKDNLMLMMPDADWDSVLKTNLDSFFYVTKALVQGMMAKRFGRIINVVSLSGIKGLPGQVNYSASKAGVIGATKALAQEVGRRGVTVNCVAPGFIKTDMTEAIDPTPYRNVIPMQRFGEAEEVAGVVAFLASKDASYVTGEVIHVNGGLYT
ncbi:MAG: 3-oxoacyl-ACP reductase FabG [Bacteroidetes bacterium]|nr:3-oxoacyl-ACP reductase FabG [Bacteroidota bacterium]